MRSIQQSQAAEPEPPCRVTVGKTLAQGKVEALPRRTLQSVDVPIGEGGTLTFRLLHA